jgi:hypothetical protein
MKIVVLPGVGFHNDTKPYENLSKYLMDNLNCEATPFYWKHDRPLPDVTLPYKSIRSWGYEVILDFQQVILHAFDMVLPEADYYIGHSAGSILALAQKDKPCIIFGSPAILVEAIRKEKARENSGSFFEAKLMESAQSKKNILNIINKYDQLAYYLNLPNTENIVYQGSWFNPNTYNPLQAHLGYWDNDFTRKKIIETIKVWEKNKSK